MIIIQLNMHGFHGRKFFTALGENKDLFHVVMTTPILYLPYNAQSTLITCVPDGTLSGVGVSFIGCGWVGMYILQIKPWE